jgi:hypothetical protein
VADKFNADSFGTFLETMQRGRKGRQQTGTPIRILQALAAAPAKRLSTAELLKQSSAPITEFANALTALQEPGFIKVETSAGEETAQITPAGERVAELGVLP